MPSQLPVLSSEGQNCTGKPLAITPQGLALQLQVVAGQELANSSVLTLKPVIGNNQSAELEVLTAVISTDQGVFSKDKKISWLMADWSIERPLSMVNVKLSAANPACKMRIKIFTNGHWLPLTPMDIFALDSVQVFSPVMASKAMIELVSAGQYAGLWQPLSVETASIELGVSTAPSDIELSLASQSIAKNTELLSTLGLVVNNFASAINAYVQQNPNEPSIPLWLSAKTAGKVVIDFSPVTQTLIEQLPEQADGKLLLFWQNETTQASVKTSISLSKKAQLQELGFLVDYAPIAEKLCFNVAITANSKAQLANERAQIAQGFQTDEKGVTLTGFDIKLEKRSESLTATLALYPDQHGYPASNPYGGAVLTIDDSGNWQNSWLNLTFPKPVHLSDVKWWLVLTVQQGDAFWWFADNPPEPASAALYRMDQSAWLAACAENSWLQTRARLSNPDTANLTRIDIQRGNANVSLTQQKNFFTATAEALKSLNADTSAIVTLEAIAPATGVITLSKLRLTYR
jgi:hypothetical protein